MESKFNKTIPALQRHLICLSILILTVSYGSVVWAQSVTIRKPFRDQVFCGTGPFTIPLLAEVPPNECEGTTIEWSVTIGGKTYTAKTLPNDEGKIEFQNPLTQNNEFGVFKVQAVAKSNPSSTQQFTGTGRYFGQGALRVTIRQAGQNFEGYILNNCDPREQDLVVGQRTDNLPVGSSYLISGFCTDAHADIPRSGRTFSAPWTSESTSHWAYWERQAVIYANKHAFSDTMRLLAIWYISDRSGQYNQILSNVGYPRNGPTKNFGGDATPPTTPIVKDDGDSTRDNSQLHATWTSNEPESGIVEYQYAIGTSRGATNVVDWTSAGGVPEVTHRGLVLEVGKTYYFAVRAQNGAGLWSNIGSSDGIRIVPGEFNAQTVYNFPNPFSPEADGFTRITFHLTAAGEVKIKIFDTNGGLIWEQQKGAHQGKNYTTWDGKTMDGKPVANGVYFCRVDAQGKSVIKKIAVLNDYKP